MGREATSPWIIPLGAEHSSAYVFSSVLVCSAHPNLLLAMSLEVRVVLS